MSSESLVPVSSTLIDERFTKPQLKEFSRTGAFMSVASLLVMFCSNVYFINRLGGPCRPDWCYQAHDGEDAFVRWMFSLTRSLSSSSSCPPRTGCWLATVPFFCAALGSGVGMLFEGYLLYRQKPFQFQYSRFMSQLNDIRKPIYALVLTSSTFAIICFGIQEPESSLPWLARCSFFVAGGLSICFFFDAEPVLPLAALALLLAQIILPLWVGVNVEGTMVPARLASASGLAQLAAVLVGVETPMTSLGFHILATLSGLFLYEASVMVGMEDLAYHRHICEILFPSEWKKYSYTFSFLLGAVLVLKLSKPTYNAFRSSMSFVIWTLMFGVLLGQPLLLHNPFKISEAYRRKGGPKRLETQPYSIQHPRFMGKHIDIPSIAGDLLPETVEIFSGLVSKVVIGFDVMTLLGHFFPTDNCKERVQNKVRLKVYDDGQDLYPSWLYSRMPMFPLECRKILRTPEPMKEAFLQGNLLGFLGQYGMGNAFLKLAKETGEYPYFTHVDDESKADGLVVDLRHQEQYETKPGFEPYGGVAYFRIKKRKLVVEWVITPRGTQPIEAVSTNGSYRRAERMILASLMFEVVVGKHLSEIHQAYNLLEVALHNCFDCELNQTSTGTFNGHPLRLILYLHVFSHSLATEMTVTHLVEEGAVFSQVFALSYNSLCDYITRQHDKFEYGSDQDFDYRQKCMGPMMEPEGEQPNFGCSVHWELEYKNIFQKYANSMVDAVYETDQHAKNDGALKGFWNTIDHLFYSVSDRYERLETKAGVARFIADTMHQLCVRHQVYGTTAVTAATDSRIINSQVHTDGGPPALDEWRSLAFVGAATAYPFFVNLLQDAQNIHRNAERNLADVFDDVAPIRGSSTSKASLVSQMKKIFGELERDLRNLQTRWELDGVDLYDPKHDTNFMYQRPLPVVIRVAAGY